MSKSFDAGTPDDRLRAALLILDPAAGAPIDPISSDRARTLLEEVMSTPLPTDTDTARPSGTAAVARPAGRRRWFALGGAGVAALAAFAFVVSNSADDATPTVTATELELPAIDPISASCAVFDPVQLEGVEIAFGGTVVEITGELATGSTVRLEVDRWYRGGDSDVVDVVVPSGFTAALDGVDFVAGGRYLVTAIGGVVTSCGSSGPATPEFEQIFADVFG